LIGGREGRREYKLGGHCKGKWCYGGEMIMMMMMMMIMMRVEK
jgi:hypothetical protein